MPLIEIDSSPLIAGRHPVRIHYRDAGEGFPLVFLHSGWGYEIYHFRHQIEAFGARFRIIAPDRTGYGGSLPLDDFPADFHRAAARETLAFLDALRITRFALWGHSDGAVIAALIGLMAPERVAGIILEACHIDRVKAGSRDFFRELLAGDAQLSERVVETLARDHGADRWRSVLAAFGRAWLAILDRGADPAGDLYGNRLAELRPPVLVIHGADDLRTEPGELETLRRSLPQARFHVIEGGGHAPHVEHASVDECNRVAGEFLEQLLLREGREKQDERAGI